MRLRLGPICRDGSLEEGERCALMLDAIHVTQFPASSLVAQLAVGLAGIWQWLPRRDGLIFFLLKPTHVFLWPASRVGCDCCDLISRGGRVQRARVKPLAASSPPFERLVAHVAGHRSRSHHFLLLRSRAWSLCSPLTVCLLLPNLSYLSYKITIRKKLAWFKLTTKSNSNLNMRRLK